MKQMSYYKVEEWMTDVLNLKHGTLYLYAFISSFPQGYSGSVNYAAKRTGLTRESASRTIKQMVADGLLLKTNENKRTVYMVTDNGENHRTDGGYYPVDGSSVYLSSDGRYFYGGTYTSVRDIRDGLEWNQRPDGQKVYIATRPNMHCEWSRKERKWIEVNDV